MNRKKYKKSLLILIIATFFLVGRPILAGEETVKVQEKKHSPTGALLRSAAFPGWGQYYNKKYLKAAIIGLAESILIYQTAYYWRRASKYEDLYLNDTSTITRLEKYNSFDRYHDLRNQHIWLLGISVFYSMFDAYVDAHLKNFDIDLTPEFDPTNQNYTLWLTLGLRY
jgi:Family of unknown function (DUF5683)